ncbi:MAG TPA: DUF4365 domain-containing protein [Noviherbaspirillum sp.]
MGRYDKTERLGINAVERIVIDDLEWIFREQPIVDMGIDGHIELVDEEPTGKLIAVQIKSGSSHFHETTDAFVYYGELTHLNYWVGHSLPVILVAHFPGTGETLWALVNTDSAVRTQKHWKIAIPKSNRFGLDTRESLAKIFNGSPAQQRVRKLSIDEPLMRHIAAGGKVSVELEDWINKSLGRTPVEVFICDAEGNETLSQNWFQYFIGYGMKELAETLFPWAIASVDEDFYEENNEFLEDPHDVLMRAIDEDHGIVVPHDLATVYPYKEVAGEIECYRLKLELNELGRSFLVVSAYLNASESTEASP